MVSPTQVKKNIKEQILKALERDGRADKDILVASLKLESGFSEKIVLDIMSDLVKVQYIEIVGNEISLTQRGKSMVNGSRS